MYWLRNLLKNLQKQTRRETDEWEQWAQDNYTLCPSCWGKAKIEEEKAAGLKANVLMGDPYVATDETELCIVLFGDTFLIKDELKAMGFLYPDNYQEQKTMITAGRPQK